MVKGKGSGESGISGVVEKGAKRIGGVGGVDLEGYKLHMHLEIGTTLARSTVLY